ncbi:MAG: hypothetical protein ABRQ39_30325 [Candidatus Eremiobacterota bacterium]
MSRVDLLLKTINNSRNVRFNDFETLIKSYGFSISQGSTRYKSCTNTKFKAILSIQKDKNYMAFYYQVEEFLGFRYIPVTLGKLGGSEFSKKLQKLSNQSFTKKSLCDRLSRSDLSQKESEIILKHAPRLVLLVELEILQKNGLNTVHLENSINNGSRGNSLLNDLKNKYPEDNFKKIKQYINILENLEKKRL